MTVLFQGAGTRWIGVTKADHPAHELFEAIKDTACWVSCGCADVFGARGSNQIRLWTDQKNPVPVLLDYPALASSLRMATILTF